MNTVLKKFYENQKNEHLKYLNLYEINQGIDNDLEYSELHKQIADFEKQICEYNSDRNSLSISLGLLGQFDKNDDRFKPEVKTFIYTLLKTDDLEQAKEKVAPILDIVFKELDVSSCESKIFRTELPNYFSKEEMANYIMASIERYLKVLPEKKNIEQKNQKLRELKEEIKLFENIDGHWYKNATKNVIKISDEEYEELCKKHPPYLMEIKRLIQEAHSDGCSKDLDYISDCIFTFPYYCTFLLRRYLKTVDW